MNTLKQYIRLFIMTLAVLAAVWEQATGAVRGKTNPIRAGVNSHTTYSLTTTETTLAVPTQSKGKALTGTKDNQPDIIQGFFLDGADCRISETPDGRTRVEVYVKSTQTWEPVEIVDTEGNVIDVDWSKIVIFAGSHYVPEEGKAAPTEPLYVDSCHISMTGGKVYGIYAAGMTDTEDTNTGSVRGVVTVTISGGEIHDISNMGVSAITAGKNDTGYLFGHFNLIMTGGTYTGNTMQGIRNRDRQNEKGNVVGNITKSTAIITGAKFSFEEALPNSIDSYDTNRYIPLEGRIVQMDDKSVQHTANGVVRIPPETELTIPRFVKDTEVIINNEGALNITSCAKDAFNANLIQVVGMPYYLTGQHRWEEHVARHATCYEEGMTILICKNCGETEQGQPIAPAHVYGTIPAHEATCYEEGHIEYEGCLVCGKRKNTEQDIHTSKKAHSYVYENDFSTTHGCITTEGQQLAKRGVCAVCGDVDYLYPEPVPGTVAGPAKHNFGSWNRMGDESKSTAHPHGMENRYCMNCQKEDQRPLMEHNADRQLQDATCTEDGHAFHYRCRDCNVIFVHDPDVASIMVPIYLPQVPVTEKYGHIFMDENPKAANALAEKANCQHGTLYYKSCLQCGTASQDKADLFESGIPTSHTYHIVDVKPDANFPEAGLAQLQCEACGKSVDFDFNIYTENTRNLHNPTHITASSSEDTSASETIREATCYTGRAPYTLTLSANGQQESFSYNAVLPAVKGKHAWDKDGHCRYCHESSEAFIRRTIEIHENESSMTLHEELFETYKALDEETTDVQGMRVKAQAIWQRSIEQEQEPVTIGLFRDTEWEGDMNLTRKDVTFDLHEHTLSVPEGIRQEGAVIDIKSGTLTSPTITGQAEQIKVDRQKGASIRIVLTDEEDAFAQYLQSNPQAAIDAQYTRNFEVTNVWQPFSVPFAVMPTAELLISCDIAEVSFSQDNPSQVKLVVNKVEADKALAPNKAYLVRPKTAGKYTFCTMATDEEQIQNGTQTDRASDFICTYEPISRLKTQGIVYMGHNNNMVRSKRDDTTLRAFRWYFNPETLNARMNQAAKAAARSKTTGPNGEEGYYRGDIVTVSVDERFSVADAANLIAMLNGAIKLTVEADANGDAVVNTEDVAHIANLILGKKEGQFVPTKEEIVMPQHLEDIEEEDVAPL